jgi:hypothetical protein
MEKRDVKYFVNEVKELAVYPESDFKDAAYKALEDECLEELGVKLISFSDVKKSAIAKSVGLKDSKDFEEKEETKPLSVHSDKEERFYDNLYRSMDDVETARKYAGMTSRDVYNKISQGGTI